MTPKERAWQLASIRDRAEQLMVSQFGMDIDHPDEFENDIRAIEQAITAAVEESEERTQQERLRLQAENIELRAKLTKTLTLLETTVGKL